MTWVVGSIPLNDEQSLYSYYYDVPLFLPDYAAPGSRFILCTMMETGGATYNLNGHTLLGETAALSHTVSGGWTEPYPYKLVTITGVLDSSMKLPVFQNRDQDQPWCMVVFPGNPAVHDYQQAVNPDGYSGTMPAVAGGGSRRVIRIWTTMGDNPFIKIPAGVSYVAGSNPDNYYHNDLQQAMTEAYDDGSSKTASGDRSYGWMMAAMSVDG